MATIYDLSTGRIISENPGITTIDNHADLPECGAVPQPVAREHGQDRDPAVDEYMNLIRELLKQL